MAHVLSDHRLTDAIGSQEQQVFALVEEAQGKQVLDVVPVDALGPEPVEVAHQPEAAQVRAVEAALQAPFLPLGLFDVQQGGDPGLLPQLAKMRTQAEQSQALRPRQGIRTVRRGHLCPPVQERHRWRADEEPRTPSAEESPWATPPPSAGPGSAAAGCAPG